jgi:glucokinase
MLILSCDIGGTNSRLQLTRYSNRLEFEVLHREHFANSDFQSFLQVLSAFLKEKPLTTKIECACFAVAGPILNGKVQCTNLPWFLDEADLTQELGFTVKLMNDFEAIGYGLSTLASDNVLSLQPGKRDPEGPISLIGAGTGLGIALVHSYQGHSIVTPTEGGHVDFSPTDDEQMQLLSYLRKKHHRVSVERILSGPGLSNVYKFCREFPLYNQQENPQLKFLMHHAADPAADILRYATQEGDPISLRTIDIFIKCYGAASGNLALTTLPRGGLFIVGGIAPKILPLLQDGRFLDSFLDKGRMSSLLKDIPIQIVLDPYIGLQGATNYGYQIKR